MTETLTATADSIEAMVVEELADEFHLLGPLGWGKWGMRFRAEDLYRAEEVILTALPALDAADPSGGERYLETMRAASLLDHPHLLPLSGYGVCGPLRWFTTAPTSDETLATRLATAGPLPLPEVKRLAHQLASALDQAHRRGIAHGALSANEILIDRAGWVRVVEVGIAAGVEPQAPARPMIMRVAQGSDQVEFSRILHACLTGGASELPLSTDLPIEVEQGLRRGRSPRPAERFRDLLDLVDAIDPSGDAPPAMNAATPPAKGAGPNAWDAFLDQEELEPAAPPLVQWGARALVALVGAVLVALSIEVGRQIATPEQRSAAPMLAEEAPLTETPATPPPIIPAQTTPAPPPKRVAAAPPRRSPRPTVRAAPQEEPVALLSPAPEPLPATGTLSVSSFPWGELSVDGQVIGNTPRSGILLKPGKHTLRITRDGYQAYETTFDLPPGRTIRLTQVTLKELTL